MLNIVGVKTDVMAALCSVIPLLGVRRLASTFSRGGSEAQGEDVPLLDVHGLPVCLPDCENPHYRPTKQSHKTTLLVTTCTRILDCSNLRSGVTDP